MAEENKALFAPTVPGQKNTSIAFRFKKAMDHNPGSIIQSKLPKP